MNLKALIEKRNQLAADMQKLIDAANTETRALTNDEMAEFERMKAEIKALDATIKASEEMRAIEDAGNQQPKSDKKGDTTEKLEYRAFDSYLRGRVTELRDDPDPAPADTAVNMTKGENGAVIPTTIIHKIIDKVYNICPIYSMATRYNMGGNITIPYYDDSESDITMAYAEEFVELESSAGKIKNITLGGFLAGVLTLVSKSLLNNSNFDLVGFVINKMAENIAKWVENELLNGTEDKIEGLSTLAASVEAASSTAVTSDELIDLQEEVPDAYQGNAVWIMSKKTRKAIRKLKDGQGNYLLNKDFNARWGYTLLGKEVYVSDNMPDMAAGKKAVLYGDFSGLAVKVSENWEINILREKFATQHALGIYAYLEMDSKIENAQKIKALAMK